jgi:hypothetical protein
MTGKRVSIMVREPKSHTKLQAGDVGITKMSQGKFKSITSKKEP